MKSITIKIPDNIEKQKAKMILAVALFEMGELSSGQAAKIVGISRVNFLEQVGNFGASIFGETEDDLALLNKLAS